MLETRPDSLSGAYLKERITMNTTTLIIIVLVVLFLGGGWGWSRRGR